MTEKVEDAETVEAMLAAWFEEATIRGDDASLISNMRTRMTSVLAVARAHDKAAAQAKLTALGAAYDAAPGVAGGGVTASEMWAEIARLRADLDHNRKLVDYYEKAQADTRRLTREIAVLIDGEGAALGPALCDIVPMVRELVAGRDAALEGPPPPVTKEKIQGASPVTIAYTNWRGETAKRNILPLRVWYGSTEWHPGPQWLLAAIDVEKGAERDFALKDVGGAATIKAMRAQWSADLLRLGRERRKVETDRHALLKGVDALADVLRGRGRNNSLHDINRVANALVELGARVAGLKEAPRAEETPNAN